MIQLFNLNNHIIDTSKYSNLLHDSIVTKFEDTIANYVGAKYAVTFNSATSALFLALLDKNTTITVPSMIPPVVLNAIITSDNKHNFIDDISWVGDSYVLHDFGDYKIVDSAQKLEKNQFKNECNPNDLMVFSFYPTKPVGSSDGGMIVSDDLEKIIGQVTKFLSGTILLNIKKIRREILRLLTGLNILYKNLKSCQYTNNDTALLNTVQGSIDSLNNNLFILDEFAFDIGFNGGIELVVLVVLVGVAEFNCGSELFVVVALQVAVVVVVTVVVLVVVSKETLK